MFEEIIDGFVGKRGCSKQSAQIFSALLTSFKDFNFTILQEERKLLASSHKECLHGQSYLLEICLHPQSIVEVTFCVQHGDAVQDYFLENMKKRMKLNFLVNRLSDVDDFTASMNKNISLVSQAFERLHVYREKKASVALLVSKDPEVLKRFRAKIALLEREVRDLIPGLIRYFPKEKYCMASGRPNSFFAHLPGSDKYY